MKTIIWVAQTKKTTIKAITFLVLAVILIMTVMPMGSNEVYGSTDTYKVRYISSITNEIFKEGYVSSGGFLEPPTSKDVYKKGYKFLGWDDYIADVDEDRDIYAVYELIMTTTDEVKGKLAKPKTAEPIIPKEDNPDSNTGNNTQNNENSSGAALTTSSGSVTPGTSEDAITSPEVIEAPQTPKADMPYEGSAKSPVNIVLIILAGLILLCMIVYIVFVFRKRRKQDDPI